MLKKLMQLKALFIIILISLVLNSCQEKVDSNLVYFIDDSAEELFTKNFKIVNLIDHKCYYNDVNEFYFDLTFNENIKIAEVVRMRDLFYMSLVKHSMHGDLYPYGNVKIHELETQPFDSYTMNIYVGNDLLVSEVYVDEKIDNYYENINTKISSKILNKEEFKSDLTSIIYEKIETIERSLKDDVIIFKLNNEFDEMEFDVIKETLQHEVETNPNNKLKNYKYILLYFDNFEQYNSMYDITNSKWLHYKTYFGSL